MMKSRKRAREEQEQAASREAAREHEGGDRAHDPADLETLEGESEAQIIDEMTQRVAELDNRYKRALADYQNSQRRAIENERRARQEGMVAVVEALIPVMDHFKLALSQDPEQVSAEQIFGGVKVILDELTKTLGAYGVAPIEPAPNDEFDPMRHQAMMMVETDEVEPGRVAAMLQSGYALGERVIRPAKVSVRPGEEAVDEEGDDGASGGDEESASGDEPGAQE